MRARLVRLGLAGAIAVGVAAPATSHAFVCAPDFQAVCTVIGKACVTVNNATKGRVECAFG